VFNRYKAAAGFTLWELLLTMTVAAVVAGLGIPALRDLVLDMRLTADVNGIVAAIQTARSEAVKRRRPVIMCNSADAMHCDGAGDRWIVFVNEDDDAPPVRDSDEPLLLSHRLQPSTTVEVNRRHFVFRPFLRRSTNGTLTLCDMRGGAAGRAVIVSYTGRPRSVRATGARPVRCLVV